MTVTLIENLVFPEGPRWHEGALWFSDMHQHKVFHLVPGEPLAEVASFDDRPSGLGFLEDGTPVVVLMRSCRLVRFGPRGQHLHCDLAPLGGTHLNDMVMAGNGNAYVGLRHHTASASDRVSPESVVLVRPDGSHQIVAEDMWGPNGSAISPDGRTLVVAETRAGRISAFTIAADGTLSDRRVFAQMDGAPDGLCLDAEGAVWVGNVFNGRFERIVEGGEVVQTIQVADGKWAVACVLGDADRRTLMMLTAHETVEHFFGLTDFEADLNSTSRGYVECAKVPVPGAGRP